MGHHPIRQVILPVTKEYQKMELQKKVSVARVTGWKMSSALIHKKGVDGRLYVGTYMGSASGTKKGTTDFGDWEALIGIFRAISPSGDVFESGTCFLPDVALGMITGQLNAGAVGVDFAFRLYAVLDENSPVGFSYRAEPLLNTVDNPLDRIAKLLTAPKTDDAPVIPDPLIKAAPVESKEKK
jgi:hypothetical protein